MSIVGALSGLAGAVGSYAGTAARLAGGHAANGVSARAQAAQGQFNAAQAAQANTIGDNRTAQQYGFNSSQAMLANNISSDAWDKAAAWNEMMWQRNADWQEKMWQKNANWNLNLDNTKYQRAIMDMEKAGLNPILAVTGGGINVNGGNESALSMSSPSMGGYQGQGANGGLLNGLSASESNYTGQAEYQSALLGLLAKAFEGISSAKSAFADINVNFGSFAKDLGEQIEKGVSKITDPDVYKDAYKAGTDALKGRNPYQKHLPTYTDLWKRSQRRNPIN